MSQDYTHFSSGGATLSSSDFGKPLPERSFTSSVAYETVVILAAVVVVTVLLLLLVLSRTLLGWDPPMPSSPSMRAQVLAIVRHLAAGRGAPVLVELGSGWGGLSRALARELPKADVSGVEVAFAPWLHSTVVGSILGRRHGKSPRYRRGTIESEILESDVIYICYLSGSSMSALRKQYERDQPHNGALVSCAFAMPGWTPTQVRYTGDLFPTAIYVYRY